jgi:N6-L-threonylcarbamoyladenine synthase
LKDKKLILGIETSCDDTSVAIIRDGEKPEILSHLKFGQEDILKHWGGVVPEIAARNHLEKITPLLDDVFDKSNVTPEDIDLISVTTLPGLLGPLLTGLNAAKTLSLILQKPIYPANHLYAHLEAIHLTEDIKYPYLGLLVSGGHSIYFWVENKSSFHVLGSTIDDASGEAFDKGGKMLNLGYPAGHIVDHLGQFGDGSKFPFPIGMKASADARLSFSGLKTSLRVFLEKNPDILSQRPSQFDTKEDSSQDFYDLCASYQNAIAKALSLKMRYAIKIAKEKHNAPSNYSIVVGGGVACNSEIRKQLKEKYNKVSFVAPQFCTDNGAMIANLGRINIDSSLPYPDSLRLDARGRFINKEDFK